MDSTASFLLEDLRRRLRFLRPKHKTDAATAMTKICKTPSTCHLLSFILPSPDQNTGHYMLKTYGNILPFFHSSSSLFFPSRGGG